MTGALFEAFKIFNLLIPLLGLVYAVITFFAGIKEVYVTGFAFFIGIITAGFLLKDFVTSLAGVISLAGIAISYWRS